MLPVFFSFVYVFVLGEKAEVSLAENSKVGEHLWVNTA